MRSYCLILVFAAVILAAWALPTEENEVVPIENGIVDGDDVEGVIEDGVLNVSGRSYHKKKPHKGHKSKEHGSSSEDHDHEEPKKAKCVCFGKKPITFTLQQYPSHHGKPHHSSSESGEHGSKNSGEQGNQNQGGSNNKGPNKGSNKNDN